MTGIPRRPASLIASMAAAAWPRAGPVSPVPPPPQEPAPAFVALAPHEDEARAADGGEPSADERGRARAGRVHEVEAGDAELADRAGVERAHLGGGEDGPHGISARAAAAGPPTG